LLIPSNNIHALTRDNTLLILDASGSMWSRVEGRSKIETARDVIVDLLAVSQTGHKLGLMSYGHRRKGDCADIELLVPPAQHTNSDIQRSVKSIKPKGKTPLSASVVEAARVLNNKHNKATVILVSDGRETCNYDPCRVALELEAAGVDFTAHVIGFNVKDPIDLTQLRCIAENTGGRFVKADNGAELSLALQSVTDVFKPTAMDEQRSVDRKTTGDSSSATDIDDVDLRLLALQADRTRSRRERLENRRRGIEPRPAPATDQPGAPGAQSSQPDIDESLKQHSDEPRRVITDKLDRGQLPGKETDGLFDERAAEIPASSVQLEDSVASLTVPPVIYTLQLFSVRWTGPGLEEDLITLALPDSPADSWLQALPVSTGKKLKFKAPETPGEYEIRYVSARSKILSSVTIDVRKAEATLLAPQEARSGRLVRIRWKGGTKDPKDAIIITRADAPLSSAINRRFIRAQTSVMLLMPARPGEYELRYVQAGGNLIAKESIVVR